MGELAELFKAKPKHREIVSVSSCGKQQVSIKSDVYNQFDLAFDQQNYESNPKFERLVGRCHQVLVSKLETLITSFLLNCNVEIKGLNLKKNIRAEVFTEPTITALPNLKPEVVKENMYLKDLWFPDMSDKDTLEVGCDRPALAATNWACKERKP